MFIFMMELLYFHNVDFYNLTTKSTVLPLDTRIKQLSTEVRIQTAIRVCSTIVLKGIFLSDNTCSPQSSFGILDDEIIIFY